MLLADTLDRREFRIGAAIYLPIDPATEFGFIGAPDGDPERVRRLDRIPVPVYPWAPLGLDEEAILARILVQGAAANPLKLGRLRDAKPKFWAPYRALLRHPSVKVDKVDPRIPQIRSEEVPTDRVIVITGAHRPIYVVSGNRRNVFVWNRMSLLSVEFACP